MRKLLPATDADPYFGFRLTIDTDSKPEIKIKSRSSLKRLKSPLNLFEPAYFNQNNMDIKMLQNCSKIVVYFRPNQVFPFLYQVLPVISDLVDKKASILWLFAVYLFAASSILYYNARFYPCSINICYSLKNHIYYSQLGKNFHKSF